MTLDVEGIVCDGLDVEEALRGARRFELLLFLLSLSDRLVGILRPIVLTLIVNVFRPQPEGSNGDVIGPEFIGCDPGWCCALFLQQFSHQTQRCPGVPLRLNQEIQNLAFIVDGAP